MQELDEGFPLAFGNDHDSKPEYARAVSSLSYLADTICDRLPELAGMIAGKVLCEAHQRAGGVHCRSRLIDQCAGTRTLMHTPPTHGQRSKRRSATGQQISGRLKRQRLLP